VKDLIKENQPEILIGFVLGSVLLFIFMMFIADHKQQREMAKLGMCASKPEGSTNAYWTPCKT